MTNLAVAMKMKPKIIPLIKVSKHKFFLKNSTVLIIPFSLSLSLSLYLFQRVVYMGMGHRLDEQQAREYEYKGPDAEYENGFGTEISNYLNYYYFY